MAESLGKAILELDADAGPLNTALNLMEGTTVSRVGQIGAKLKEIFGSNFKAGMVVAGAAVVAGLAVVTKAVYDMGAGFDRAYDTIRTTTGATGQELEGLKDDFKEVFRSVPTDIDSASEAVGQLNQRLGLTGPPLQQVSAQVLELSRLTGTDLNENIASVTRLFGDWGVSTEQMTPTLDKLWRLSQNTGIGVSELSRLMVQFGSPLRQLGLDFDTSAAMFAKFEREGVNIQAVLPGLKMGLKNLSKPVGDAAEVMKRYGITADDPAQGLIQTMDAIKNAGSAAEANKIAFAIFGTRAGPDLAAAVREGRFELDTLVKNMNNGKETIRGAAKDTNDLKEQWTLFKNNALVKLEPAAVRVFDTINKGLELLMSNSSTVLPVVTVLFAVLGAAATVSAIRMTGAGIATVATWVAAQAAAVASAATQIAAWTMMGLRALASAAQMAAAWFIALGPIGWVAAAIIGIVALIVANWDWVKRQTEAAWNWIKDFFSKYWPFLLGVCTGGVGLIVGLIIKNWDKVKEITSKVWNAITGAVIGALSAIGDALVDAFVWYVNFISSIPGAILNALGDLGTLLYDAGKAVVQGLLDGIEAALGAVWDVVSGIGDTIKSLKGPLPKDLKLLVPEGRAIITGLGEGMQDRFMDLQGEIAAYGPQIQRNVSNTYGDYRVTPNNTSSLDALRASIDRLVDSGVPGVLDALTEVVTERQGYGPVSRRRLTAGDGSVALP